MHSAVLFVLLLHPAAWCHEQRPTLVAQRPRRRPPASESLVASGFLATHKQDPSVATHKPQADPGTRGGASGRPSFWWAVLHNWLYFLALGLSLPVLPRVVSTIVNADGSPNVSPRSSVVGGDIESLDKALTFLFVGSLGALSDVKGRKPLMAYSALGFAFTCLIQATARGTWALYLADLVDGVSSCMNAVCQAYVADASPPERRAGNLGIFQGVSVAGAFILGIPLSSVISAAYGLRAPMFAAAAVGLLNFVIAATVTPESLPPRQRAGRKLDLASANPLGALRRLFASTPLLAGSAAAFSLLWLSNTCVTAVFGNFVNHLFGWGPEESGPLLVLIGLVLATAPRLLVPRLGLRRSIQLGTLIYAAGQLATGLAHTPVGVVSSVLLMSVGCIGTVALVAFIANQAPASERGALLGGLETLQELCEAFAHSGYGRLFAFSISNAAPARLPGACFLAASACMLAALGVATRTFALFPEAAAKFLAS